MPPTSNSVTREALKIITAENQIKSPLLRLPAEIRNPIYEYVLTNEKIQIYGHDNCEFTCAYPPAQFEHSLSHAHFPEELLSVLYVCQEIHTDAKLLVFRLNKLHGDLFYVDDFLVEKWLDGDQVSALRSLDIDIEYEQLCRNRTCVTGNLNKDCEQMLERLAKLPGLEDVMLHLWCFDSCHQIMGNVGKLAMSKIDDIFRRENKTVKLQMFPQWFSQVSIQADEELLE